MMESFHKDPRRRRKLSNGHVIAPLLEAPLPMPRRSCYGSAAAAAADAPVPRRFSAADASLQRRHVPFSWETAPGVPKMIVGGSGGDVPRQPRPPPGRCGSGGAPWCRASSCHEHTTTDGSSEDGGGGDTFSDALDRASSSDRLALAALSARLSSVDGRGAAGLPSFIMDRFLPAANVIAATSADKPRPRRSPSPRRSVRRDEEDDEEEAAAVARARQVMMNAPRRCDLAREQPKQEQQSPPRQSKDAAVQLSPRVNEEEQCDDEVASYARKCGLMLFFPWRAKPVLLSFPLSWSPRSSRASNASVASAAAPPLSPPRRSVTLGDVLEKERRLRDGGDVSRRWYEEKSGRSGKEWSGLGWGAGIVGTSKRYCADARRALSRLARSATDGGGSPRLCRERRSGKQRDVSVVGSASEMIPPLSPPSESWLSHARRSNAASSRR